MHDIEDVRAYLASPEGEARVRRALDRNKLPHDLRGDLVQEVLRRAVSFVHEGNVIENAGGLATALLHRASVDILRSRLRQPVSVPMVSSGVDDPALDPVVEVDVDAELAGIVAAGAVRRALQGLVATAPTPVAAALAYLAAAFDGAPPGDRCPQPAGGAGPREADEWTGVWYAGQHDCFPSRLEGDSAAVRKRRSRAVARLRAALATAAADAGLDGEGDHG